VIANRPGFALEASAGVQQRHRGQPARVRTESGRVLTGQPVGRARLEVAL
jgi:hypothetical protein